jgi:hypothetical protein
MRSAVAVAALTMSLATLPVTARASARLIARGSISGAYQDLSAATAAPLENGTAGNRLGGIGSGLAWAGGTTFLALPDRGPNAQSYDSSIDDTTSYIVHQLISAPRGGAARRRDRTPRRAGAARYGSG